MRRVIPALVLLFAAAPAVATGGFECRATDRSGIAINGAVGHVIASPLISVQLVTPARTYSTYGPNAQLAIGRSWLDAREIRVDLVDLQATRFEAQLRARVLPRSRAVGTLVRAGRTYPVRCTLE